MNDTSYFMKTILLSVIHFSLLFVAYFQNHGIITVYKCFEEDCIR